MRKIFRVLILAGWLITALYATSARAATGEVVIMDVEGAINPVVADYVTRGLEYAEDVDAAACVIEIDTPGGLDDSMREIIQGILNSEVPVVVYVSPSGARAASAGTYIILSAHVAAMSPNTVIGAATPVSIGEEGEVEMSDEMRAKVTNDAAAYIRSLAETYGRNADWAERAVREGISATEEECLELGVIDIIASDLETLLADIDGKEVTLQNGDIVMLQTSGAEVDRFRMSWVEEFLHVITDPNIAYILLSLAMLGIFVEISNPGLIFPGVVGGICGILAFYSLGQLPVNWAGVLLIVLAFGLFVGEVLTTSFGLFTAGGVVSLVLGSLILFKGASPVFQVNPWLIVIVTVIVTALFAFVVSRVVWAHRRQASTGREELAGKRAVTRGVLDPEGVVFFKGELWNAVSDSGRIESGEEVIIQSVDGLLLHVAGKKLEE
jgi:membrane-bound serine protease (ClpP class)